MTDEEGYNGWDCRETWACHLWLTNTEELYYEAMRICHAAGSDGAAADELKDWIDDLYHDLIQRSDENMIRDIGSLWRIDYRAIAEAFRNEESE